MKLNLNKVLIGGNLTRDPELRYSPSGVPVCTGTVALNETWKDAKTGEKKEKVSFVDFTVFGDTGEKICQWFGKGDPIILDGRLDMDEWEDKQSGQRLTKLKLVVSRFHFCGSTSKGNQEGQEPGAAPARPAPRGRAPMAEQTPAMAGVEDPDDVPF